MFDKKLGVDIFDNPTYTSVNILLEALSTINSKEKKNASKLDE